MFTECALSGAVFQVTAAEDIVTTDGTTRAKAGDVVAEITTDENGYAETPLLYLGKYEVKEIKAPFGYVLNSQTKTVELTYAGQEIAVRDTVNTAFDNDYQGVKISLSKVMENDELFGIYGKDNFSSVRFGLFAAEEIKASNGTSIPAGGLISQISLDENMSAIIAEKIPFGKYYVQEIATDDHYVLNGEKYLVTFEYMGQDIQTVDIDCGQFFNSIKRGSVHGNKVNESGEPLENAVFGLFAADTSEFTNENAIMIAVSDENGYFEFGNIPYGEYVITEIEAPDGYIFSDEKYPVCVSKDGDIVEINVVNDTTKVKISKKDITTGEELPGATLQIIDENGTVIEEWVSTSEPHFIEGKLIAGKEYTLKETMAPEGYEIANEIKFTVNADGSVTKVIMYDEHTPVPEKPETPPTEIPHTGVFADNSAAVYLLSAVLLMIVGIIIRKKHED